jgi:hypothetical protein
MIVWRALAAAVVALACWLSLTPQPPQPEGLPSGSDLIVHAIMHGGVGLALLRGWPVGRAAPAAMLSLAVGLEVGQAFVPGRDFSLADLAMNLLGAAAALGVMRALPARYSGRQISPRAMATPVRHSSPATAMTSVADSAEASISNPEPPTRSTITQVAVVMAARGKE